MQPNIGVSIRITIHSAVDCTYVFGSSTVAVDGDMAI